MAGSPGWLAGAVTDRSRSQPVAERFRQVRLFGTRPYRLALPVVVVLAIDAWLAAAGIVAVEAYAIPLGAALVIAGATARNLFLAARFMAGLLARARRCLAAEPRPTPGSWWLAAPHRSPLAGATTCVLAGAAYRLQAPMVLGASVVVAIGIDALSPVAAGLPRWIPLGTAGLVILWIGITFERRLKNARHLR